jgi:hypothetical protein
MFLKENKEANSKWREICKKQKRFLLLVTWTDFFRNFQMMHGLEVSVGKNEHLQTGLTGS